MCHSAEPHGAQRRADASRRHPAASESLVERAKRRENRRDERREARRNAKQKNPRGKFTCKSGFCLVCDFPENRQKNGRPCSDEQLRLSFRSKNTQIVGNKRSLIPVANSRPNGSFRTIDSPFVKIPPQIERTCAVRPSQIPFNGEFSTPESEFVTENGGCTAQNGHGLYDCQ